MSLPRYGKYKDSGIEWLEWIPNHWGLGPLKRRFSVCLGKMLQTDSADSGDSLKPYLRAANVHWSGVDTTDVKSMWFSLRDIEQLRLKAGDLLVSEGGDVGRSSIWRDELPECYIQNSINRVRARGDDSTRFLYYWLATLKSKGYIDVLCNKSTIAHFTAEKLAGITTPFPPIEEQNAIATFLDHETAKIDALIAEQEALILLLAEKRQATISHIVTRGLNPDVPMQDSGVAWFREIPAHWNRVQLGRLCNQISDGPHFSPSYVTNGVMFLSARNIKVDGWSLDDAKYVSEEDYDAFCKRVTPEVGDVLYTKGGTTGIARVVDLQERFQIWVHIAVLKLKRDIALPNFIAYALNSLGCYEQSQLFTRGATNNDLGLTRLAKIYLALPPIEEQELIVAFLNSETAKLDLLKTDAERAITILKERRSALVSVAITGQIDVRGQVAEQPAENEATTA